MNKLDEKLDEEIYRIGGFIMDSEIFHAGDQQKHHGRTTVTNHVMSVTRKAYKIAFAFESAGFKVDKECVILGALCHDLGIIGRDEKFMNDLQCWFKHPEYSLEEAKKLIPDMSEKLERVILNHMWPLSRRAPKYIEETIVIMADKAASFTDLGVGTFDK